MVTRSIAGSAHVHAIQSVPSVQRAGPVRDTAHIPLLPTTTLAVPRRVPTYALDLHVNTEQEARVASRWVLQLCKTANSARTRILILSPPEWEVVESSLGRQTKRRRKYHITTCWCLLLQRTSHFVVITCATVRMRATPGGVAAHPARELLDERQRFIVR
jgi:hypothetical protein